MTNDQPQLRDVIDGDLPIFFEHQLDPAANYMAAFTRKNPSDRAAFDKHWAKIRGDANVHIKTIVYGDQVVGHVAAYGPTDEKEITYWIDRSHWNQGIATAALAEFLRQVKLRPIYARAAKDNLASIRVLEKCGFVKHGEDKFFASARECEIEEIILKLSHFVPSPGTPGEG